MLFSVSLTSTPTVFNKPGPIILVGGGAIPPEALNWAKQYITPGKKIVLTCCKYRFEEIKEKWNNLIGDCQVMVANEFTEDDLQGLSFLVINGGDQWEYLTKLDRSLIQKVHDKGIIILGTSAGAMILSEFCFTAENGTITSDDLSDEKVNIYHDFVKIKSLKNTIIETHFTERDRQDRLKLFITSSGAGKGIGIDENTALCINGKTHKVFGEGHVHKF